MDLNDITNQAKNLADSTVGKEVLGKITNIAHEKIAEAKHIADEKGLGSLVDSAVNMAEVRASTERFSSVTR